MALKTWICSSYSVHSSRSSIVYSLSSRLLITFIRVEDCRSARQNFILYPTDSGLPLYCVSGRGCQRNRQRKAQYYYTEHTAGSFHAVRQGCLNSYKATGRQERKGDWFPGLFIFHFSNFCVAWNFLLIFTFILYHVDMLTELCHLLWVYQQRWYQQNIFRALWLIMEMNDKLLEHVTNSFIVFFKKLFYWLSPYSFISRDLFQYSNSSSNLGD